MSDDGTSVPWDGTSASPDSVLAIAGLYPEWCARVDGEVVMSGIGPEMEAVCRAIPGAVAAYRMPETPTAANGWQLSGPWVDA
jgi:hypothetical protein